MLLVLPVLAMGGALLAATAAMAVHRLTGTGTPSSMGAACEIGLAFGAVGGALVTPLWPWGATARREAGQPSAWPTMLTTLVLSPLAGWVPALLQGRRAHRRGLSQAYYWQAYAAAVVAGMALSLLVRTAAGR